MAERWKEADDRFIVAYFEVVGSFIGPHDLNRSRSAVVKRAAWLKKSGAWQAYEEADKALINARLIAGHMR